MPRSGCSRVKLVDRMSPGPVHGAADAENKHRVARSLLPYTEKKGTVSLWNRKLFSQKWGSFCTTRNRVIRTLRAVNFLSLSKWGHQNDLKAAACILWRGGGSFIFSTRSNSPFMARREHRWIPANASRRVMVGSVPTGVPVESVTTCRHAALLQIDVTLKAPLSRSILQFVIWAVY